MEEERLAVILKESGADQNMAEYFLSNFQEAFRQVAEWERRAKEIVVRDEFDTEAMEKAGEGAKTLQKIRISIEKARVEKKAYYLNGGRLVDHVAGVLTELCKPLEIDLQKKWKFIENKRKEAEEARRKEINRQLQEEYIAKCRAEEEEKEHLRIENEKLRKAAEDREKEIAEENRKKNAAILAERAKAAEIERKAREDKEAAAAKQRELELRLAKSVTCPFCQKQFVPGEVPVK